MTTARHLQPRVGLQMTCGSTIYHHVTTNADLCGLLELRRPTGRSSSYIVRESSSEWSFVYDRYLHCPAVVALPYRLSTYPGPDTLNINVICQLESIVWFHACIGLHHL